MQIEGAHFAAVKASVAVIVAGVVASASGIGMLTASATDGNTVAIGTVVGAIAVFGGILVQQVVRNQRFMWSIVAEKDKQLAAKDDDIHRISWEREAARFRAHERDDPGPYIPRRTAT